MSTEDIEVYQPEPAELMRANLTDDWFDPFPRIIKLAEYIQNTEFVPAELRGRAPAIASVILTGREMGLPPMVSLRHIFVVRGRPGQSAELMRAKIYQAGHELKDIEVTDTRAIIEGRRAGEEHWTRVQFTIEDARRNSIDVRFYPADKLYARATSRLAKRKFADVVMGLPALEELEDIATPADVIELAPGPGIKRARAPRKATAANTQPKTAPAAEPTEAELAEPDEWAEAEAAAEDAATEAELDERGATVKPVTPAKPKPTKAPPREVPKPPKPEEPEPEPPPVKAPPKRRRGRPTRAESEEIARERAEIAAARERAKTEAAARNQPPPAAPPVAASLERATATAQAAFGAAARYLEPPLQVGLEHVGVDGTRHAGPMSTCTMCDEDEADLAGFAGQPPAEQGEQGGFDGIPEPRCSPEQRTLVILTMREAGIITHEDRIIVAGEIIGHPIDTTTDLTVHEATRVIDTLKGWISQGPAKCEELVNGALNAWALRQVEDEPPAG